MTVDRGGEQLLLRKLPAVDRMLGCCVLRFKSVHKFQDVAAADDGTVAHRQLNGCFTFLTAQDSSNYTTHDSQYSCYTSQLSACRCGMPCYLLPDLDVIFSWRNGIGQHCVRSLGLICDELDVLACEDRGRDVSS